MKNKILISSFVIMAVLIILAAKPISFSKANFESSKGIVSKVYKGGVKDAVIELENNKRSFYINSGLDRKFKLENLETALKGKEVSIKYSIGWTPLDPFNKRARNIIELKTGKIIIFKE